MIKEPYHTKILHDYPAFEWVDIELEDGGGFQDTMGMIQEDRVALFIVDQPYVGSVTGSHITHYWNLSDIKAGQGVSEWFLWKFVLPSEGYPPIEVPYSPTWNDTSYADRVWMSPITSRPRTMWQVRQLELPRRSSTTDVLIRQYVYGPMPKGFWCFNANQKYYPTTVYTGHVCSLIRGRRVSTSGTVYSRELYRIASSSGAVRQEQGYVASSYWSSSWRTHTFGGYTQNGARVSKVFGTEEGDYLIFEVGVRQAATTTGVTIEIEFGDFADDFLQYRTDPEPRSLNPFLTIWSAPDVYHTGEGQGDFWLPRRRPCRFVSIGESVDWPEPSSQGNTGSLNEVAFGESV